MTSSTGSRPTSGRDDARESSLRRALQPARWNSPVKQRGATAFRGTGNQMSNERLEKERRSCYESGPAPPLLSHCGARRRQRVGRRAVVGRPSALPRATEDRPDEVAGEQVHFLYVIPTNAPDEQLDVNGELTTSIARMQAWLARQTRGPKLRLDTYQGQPDITFVRTSLEPIFDEDHTIRQYVERLGSRTRGSSISCTSARTGTRAVSGTWASRRRSSGSHARLSSQAAAHSVCSTRPQCTRPCTLSVPWMKVFRTGSPADTLQIAATSWITARYGSTGTDKLRSRSTRPHDYFGHGKSVHTDVADSRYLDSHPISGTPKMRVGSVTRIKAPRGRLNLGARVSNPGTGRVTVRCSADRASVPESGGRPVLRTQRAVQFRRRSAWARRREDHGPLREAGR